MKNEGLKKAFWPIIAVLLCMLCVGIYYVQLQKETAQHVYSTLSDSAHEQTNTLKVKFDGQFEVLETFAGSLGQQQGIDIDNVISRMNAIVDNSSFYRLSYINPDGTSYVNDGYVLDQSDRQFFIDVMLTAERSIQWIRDSRIGGGARVVLAVPIMSGENTIGVLTGNYDEKALRSLIISHVYAKQSYSFICNDNGDIIIGTDNAAYSRDVSNYLMALSANEIDEGYSLEKLKSDFAAARGGTIKYRTDLGWRYAVYEPLDIETADNRQWFMINVALGEAVDEEIERMSKGAIALALVVLLFVSGSGVALLVNENRSANRLKLSEQKYRVAAKQSDQSIFCFDIEKDTVTHEDARLLALGMPEELHGIPQAFIDRDIFDKSSEERLRAFVRDMREGKPECECTLSTAGRLSDVRWLHYVSTTVFGADKLPKQAIITCTDVTEQREKEAAYERF